MDQQKLEQSDLETLSQFLNAIPRNMDPEQVYWWQCPLCKGTVRGYHERGHIRAVCNDCGCTVIR